MVPEERPNELNTSSWSWLTTKIHPGCRFWVPAVVPFRNGTVSFPALFLAHTSFLLSAVLLIYQHNLVIAPCDEKGKLKNAQWLPVKAMPDVRINDIYCSCISPALRLYWKVIRACYDCHLWNSFLRCWPPPTCKHGRVKSEQQHGNVISNYFITGEKVQKTLYFRPLNTVKIEFLVTKDTMQPQESGARKFVFNRSSA